MVKTKPDVVKKTNRRIAGIIIALVVVVACIVCVFAANRGADEVVSVVKIKEGIPANAMIREDMLEEYKMYYKEFQNYGTVDNGGGGKIAALVKWDQRDGIVGTRFAAYYLRGGTVLFWDNTVKEKSKKNSYLYQMRGELLNIKMNTADFGDMVVPGDVLNIRCKYTIKVYNIPSEEAYQLAVANGTEDQFGPVEQEVYEMLFSEVAVLDMLNSSGSSIFDIYYAFISKTKQEQQALLHDSAFLASVKPTTILLEVTAEEVERYMMLGGESVTYQMTLLPRTGTNSIIDSLADIQTALSGLKTDENK